MKYLYKPGLRATIILGALLPAVVLLSLAAGSARSEEDDDDDEGVSSRYVVYEGQPALRLEEAMQEKIAIRTGQLEQSSLLREVRTIGEVVDISPLLEQRLRYLELQSEKEQVSASLKRSAETVERLSTLLSMDSNVSKRELQSARLQYEKEKIQLGSLNHRLENSYRILRQEWGNILADWAVGEEQSNLRAVMDRRSVLILIHSPFSEEADPIYINDSDDRAGAQPAHYVSPATRASANQQGNTHYYQVEAENLRAGMRLYAWLPDPKREIDGVIVPMDAIVWFNGKPWFYLQKNDDIYIKQIIDEHFVGKGGWLVPDPRLAGETVVTEGAQLLLSEEYRWQIPDEDDL